MTISSTRCLRGRYSRTLGRVRGESVRALAEAAYALVEPTVDGWPGPFSLHALTIPGPPPGLASRVELVGRELLDLLASRRRRAFRRYVAPEPAPSPHDETRLLIQLLALERGELLVSAAAPRRLPWGGLDLAPWPAGNAPVAVDRAPPSRAYQKLEEALAWMGTEPRARRGLCRSRGLPRGLDRHLAETARARRRRRPRAAGGAAGPRRTGLDGDRQRLQLHPDRHRWTGWSPT